MAYIKSKEYQEKLNNIAIKTCNEIINWLNSHNGKMPRGNIFEHGRKLKRDKMTEEEIAEVNLYHRWMYTTGIQIIHEYLEMPIEKVPEQYRIIIQEIKNAAANTIIWKEVEEWLKTHNGKMPSAAVHRDKKVLKVSEMTEEERKGINLRQRWDRSKEREIFEKYKECPEEQIPAEYREKIAKLRELMQYCQDKDINIINRMRQAVGMQIGNNIAIREQLSAENMLLEDNIQEENR